MSVDVSVVVATRNRARETETCVRNLLAQDIDASCRQVIVVDDGSDDETPTMLAPFAERGEIDLIRLPTCIGRGPARNAGLAEALGEIVVFIDSDAYAPPWFLRAHIDSHHRTPNVIVDGPAINIRRFTPSLFTAAHVRLQASLDLAGSEFVTANVSCPRAVITHVGGFDPEFGRRYGWEDVELGVRLRAQGLGRIKNQRAFVLHEQGAASLAQLADRERECGENAVLFYTKHPTPDCARKIRARRLRVSQILSETGLTGRRLLDLAARFDGRTFGLDRLAKSLYLLQCYADGLRTGMTEHKIAHLS